VIYPAAGTKVSYALGSGLAAWKKKSKKKQKKNKKEGAPRRRPTDLDAYFFRLNNTSAGRRARPNLRHWYQQKAWGGGVRVHTLRSDA